MRWTKDPDATLSYTVDWSDWLGSDTISSVAWSVPVGLTSVATSNTTTAATIALSGGTVGETYQVMCRVTTAGSLIDDRTFSLEIRHT